MKINILPIALLLSWATISSVCGAEPTVIKLWPEGPLEKPGVIIDAEKVLQPKGESDVLRITNVSDPTISIYRPASPNGTAVMVCPGGGIRDFGDRARGHAGVRLVERPRSNCGPAEIPGAREAGGTGVRASAGCAEGHVGITNAQQGVWN